MSNKLSFTIGAELKEFSRNLDSASKQITSFAEKNKKKFEQVGKSMTDLGKKASVLSAGIAALATGAFMLAKNVGNVADRLLDLKEITGLSTDALQEYEYVAKIAGVQTEAIANAAQGLTRRLASATSEASPLNIALQKLSVVTRNASGELRSGGEVMDDLIYKLAEIDNTTERNVLGAQIFGGAWKDLAPILALGADGIQQARQEAQDLGLVMSEDALKGANDFRIAMEKMQARVTGLKNQLGAKLAPVIQNILVPLFENKIAPALQKITDYLIKAIEWFSGLSSGMKTFIGVLGGILTALGPLLVALGTLIKFLPIILKGFALLTGPIGLTVAAVAALTYVVVKNWNTIKQWAASVVNYFIDLYNESLVFRAGIEALALNFKNMFAVGKFIFQSLWTIIKAVVGNIVAQFKLLGSIVKSVFTLDFDTLKKGLKDYEKAMRDNVSGIVNEVKRNFNQLTNTISGNVEKAINNVLTGKKEHVTFDLSKESAEKANGVIKESVSNAVQQGLAEGLGRRPREQAAASGLKAGGTVDMAFDRERMGFLDEVSERTKYLFKLMQEFDAELNDLIFGSIQNSFMALGDVIGDALASGGNVLQSIGKSLLTSMGAFLSDFGDQLIKYAVAAQAFDRIKQTIFKGFGTPAAAAAGIAAGIALKAAGRAIQSSASGGLSSAGSGASTPSVAGTSSFSSFRQQGQNEFVFRISGRDLVTVIDRNRQAGDRIG